MYFEFLNTDGEWESGNSLPLDPENYQKAYLYNGTEQIILFYTLCVNMTTHWVVSREFNNA